MIVSTVVCTCIPFWLEDLWLQKIVDVKSTGQGQASRVMPMPVICMGVQTIIQ